MRLSEGTRTKIKEVFAELAPAPFDLKLFGSRLDDQKRGGDIDLLLTVEAQNLQAFKDLKFKILDKLYERIGEQKIDLIIVSSEQIQDDAFLRSITGAEL